MKIAFVQFEQMTTLDLVGFYDAVTRLPRYSSMAVSWDFCGVSEEVTDDRGMTIKTPSVEPDLAQYDLVFVPGGFGTRELRHDKKFISWLQTGTDVKHKVSVCTGALLLGAAGFLTHRRATTNSSAYTLLAPYCKEVVGSKMGDTHDLV